MADWFMDQKTQTEPLKVDKELRCDRCGKYGAVQLDGKALCPECYQLVGSCCPEFGADDLWEENL